MFYPSLNNDNMLAETFCGGDPVHRRVVTNSPGLCPLDAGCQMSTGDKIAQHGEPMLWRN